VCKSMLYTLGRLSKHDRFKINDSYKLSAEINTTYNDRKINDSYKLSADIIVFRSNLSQHLYANYSGDLIFFRGDGAILSFTGKMILLLPSSLIFLPVSIFKFTLHL